MKIIFPFIISFSIIFLWTKGSQDFENSREAVVSKITATIDSPKKNLLINSKFSIAEQLCLSWIGELTQVNCENGSVLRTENFNQSTIESLKSSLTMAFNFRGSPEKIYNKKIIFINGVDYCHQQIERLEYLRNKLTLLDQSNVSTLTLRVALDLKIKLAKKKLLYIKTHAVKNDVLNIKDYKRLFDILLYLEGYSYSPNSGDFKKLSWDISRAFDQDQSFSKRVDLNTFFNEYLLYILLILPVLISFFVVSSVNLYGNICLFFVFIFMSLGLIFAVDASTNFGRTSSFLQINPLGNQINRQVIILVLGYLTVLLGFYFINIFEKLLFIVDKNISSLCLFGVFVVGLSYGFISPALGSESLKFVVVTFAAITTFRHARESFLTKKYLVNKVKYVSLFKNIFFLKTRQKKEKIASEFIAAHIFKSYASLIIVSAVTLFLSALVFGDLGGALITTLILIVLVFLIFGIKLALGGMSILFLLSLALSSTNKVQERLALMFEPMYASVSDFARLIGFMKNAGTSGHNLGEIPWCSNEGICLPLQVLSDYMPTLIYGTFGSNIGFIIFVFYCLIFLVIIGKSIYLFLIPDKKYQFVAIFVFYFATAYLIQTLTTFMGNWRIIPLTGLSVPFMSIGLSSMVFPCFILGAFMRLNYEQKDKNHNINK